MTTNATTEYRRAYAGKLARSVLRAWTAADVRAAVEQRVGGLLSWHGDAMVSAHPLVRDTFRPLALTAESARLASDHQLADLPGGQIQTRERGQRLVEIVELLLDGGQWEPADELFRGRAENGSVWKWLPAASLGMRCALAFVSTPERSEACRRELTERRLGVYLGTVGLYAAVAGELVAAQQFLDDTIALDRRTDNRKSLAIDLQNWCECLIAVGNAVDSCNAAAEALELAVALQDDMEAGDAHACLAWSAHLAGATVDAERSFIAADTISYDEDEEHRVSISGSWWATMLCDTGRTVIARRLTEANLESSVRNGWNDDAARCERALARCDLPEGAADDAEPRLRCAELAALDAHAHIDRVTGVSRGWAARVTDLRATLVPADLDPDPLATVEATVAARLAAEEARDRE